MVQPASRVPSLPPGSVKQRDVDGNSLCVCVPLLLPADQAPLTQQGKPPIPFPRRGRAVTAQDTSPGVISSSPTFNLTPTTCLVTHTVLPNSPRMTFPICKSEIQQDGMAACRLTGPEGHPPERASFSGGNDLISTLLEHLNCIPNL